jgi:uncharacterized protein YktA (UPF0223 family)
MLTKQASIVSRSWTVIEILRTWVPAKSEEKRLGKEFAKVTGGYQLYDVIKAAREQKAGQIKLSVK